MSVTAILPVPESFVRRRDAVFAPVAGVPPIVRIVATLHAAGDVVVCAAEPLIGDIRDVLAVHDVPRARVVAADAPGRRTQCIAAGLDALAGGPRGCVLLHDIAWPLISAVVLEQVVAAVRDGAVAAVPTIPVTDSIKAVNSDGAVTATVERAPLRTVQYPRGFDAAVLARLISGEVTDEIEAALSEGIPVTLVDGDNTAMRVELPDDSGYLAAVIEGVTGHPPR